MPLNALLVFLISRCVYREMLQWLHMIGGLIIIGAVTLIVLTPPDASADPDTSNTSHVTG